MDLEKRPFSRAGAIQVGSERIFGANLFLPFHHGRGKRLLQPGQGKPILAFHIVRVELETFS
jgi:hypothetical protein